MAWNWQLPDWRKFSYEFDRLQHFEDAFLRCSSEALGALRHIEKMV